jgi:hypothetical protein
MDLNRTNAVGTNDMLSAGGALVVNGGTLNVTNLGPDLITGDTFYLFNKAITGTGFTVINLPVSNVVNTVQYIWQTNLTTDGSIKLLAGASSVATNPTNITFSVSGGSLTLSWPTDHIGWRLQAQTNTVNVGLTTNWFDVSGSTTTNQVIMPIITTNGTVFYRMVYP